MAMPMNLTPIPAVIAAGASLSAEIDLGPNTLVGIVVPAGWTSAGMTFQASRDGTTWNEMTLSTGVAVNYTVAPGQYIAVDPTLWRGANAIRIRSGTLGTPVNQVAQANLTLVTKVLA